MWEGVVWEGVVWEGVVWEGVVWEGVVWGGVVWEVLERGFEHLRCSRGGSVSTCLFLFVTR